LRLKGKKQQEGGIKVPGYIVTFSDMVTLLLTFFVLLQTLAQTKDQGLFQIGKASFVEALQSYGLGILQGRNVAMNLGEYQVKYEISEPDEDYKGRTINERQEQMQRILNQLSKSMQTMPSQIVGERSDVTIADIRFATGSSELDDSAKRYLSNFCLDLQQNTNLRFVKLYVLGLARQENTAKEQWIVSAKRAKAVSDFLKRRLGASFERYIYSWGAGPGGEWVEDDSPFSSDSQIFITTIRASEEQLSSAYF
jgi:chemotaxis protein MotB